MRPTRGAPAAPNVWNQIRPSQSAMIPASLSPSGTGDGSRAEEVVLPVRHLVPRGLGQRAALAQGHDRVRAGDDGHLVLPVQVPVGGADGLGPSLAELLRVEHLERLWVDEEEVAAGGVDGDRDETAVGVRRPSRW